MRSQRFRLVSRALGLLALAVLLTPALLIAHAHLLRSDPASDAEVAPPAEIRLWFSEKPDLQFSRISLRDSTRNEIELGPLASIEPMGLRVTIPSRLRAGRYLLMWTTAASDGHRTQGTLRFRVRQDRAATPAPAAPPTAQAPQAPTASARAPERNANALVTPGSPVVMSSAVRWAEFMALLCVIGAIVFRLVILPASKWPEELAADGADRARRLAVAFAILFAIATLTRALAQSEMLTQPTTSRIDALRMLVSGTRWGLAWTMGACGIVVAFIGLVAARAARGGLAGWIIAAAGIVAVTISEALTGHSGASPHLSLAMAADVAHQLGAGGWIGGLACVLVAGLPPTRRLADAEGPLAGSRLIRAYHASALECVVLVVASGVLASCLRLRAFSDLWTTPYGSMLFRKLVFVAVVLAFGYYHWSRVVKPEWDSDTRFRFARSIVFELVAAALVVGLTALLVSTQLP